MTKSNNNPEFLVVATREELCLAKHDGPVIITGIGALNVMKALKDLDRDAQILNVGYCGSGAYPIGTHLSIWECTLWHPNIKYNEPTFALRRRTPGLEEARCYTITDFGGDPSVEAVFEMELAFILGMGFRNVRAIKIVSDNCNFDEYQEAMAGASLK